MILKLVTAPTEEPVSRVEAKAHLRVDITDDDAYIDGLIVGARIAAEQIARRSFVTQTFDFSMSEWPSEISFALPRPPLVNVTSITYVDSAGVTQTMSAGDYVVDSDSEPGRIWLNYGKTWPTSALRPGPAIKVRYQAGYGAAVDVPMQYKQAILLMVGHFYENREEIVVQSGVAAVQMPMAAESLLTMDRGWF